MKTKHNNMKTKIEIKNRWTGKILFEFETENNSISKTVSEAVKSKADLSGADLSGADLSGADLSGADLRWANLRWANLSGADLSIIKNDFWAKLLKLKNEIQAFKEKIIAGEIDGSCYEGECCCFVGTFANLKNVNYDKLEGVYPDSGSPTERWFLGISKGDTPEKSQITKITLDWIEEFETLISKT